MPANTPTKLRQSLRKSRQQLSQTERQQYDYLINQRILKSGILLRSPNIASYMGQQGEPSLAALIKTCEKRRISHYLPTLKNNNSLNFSKYRWGDNIKYNRFNIAEPSSDEPLDCRFLSVILMPLLGYDHHGSRLGMGGGFYDRALSFTTNASCRKRPLLIGIAYNLQQVPYIDRQTWDVPLDAVITEQNTLYFSKRANSQLR